DHAAENAGAGKRQHVAGRDEAAVAVRAALAEGAAVEERDLPAGAGEVIGRGRADDAAADHDDPAGAHERIPMRNGSAGSKKSVASAVMYAEPVIVGMTRSPSTLFTAPSKTVPRMLSCRQTWPTLILPSANKQASLALVPV